MNMVDKEKVTKQKARDKGKRSYISYGGRITKGRQ